MTNQDQIDLLLNHLKDKDILLGTQDAMIECWATQNKEQDELIQKLQNDLANYKKMVSTMQEKFDKQLKPLLLLREVEEVATSPNVEPIDVPTKDGFYVYLIACVEKDGVTRYFKIGFAQNIKNRIRGIYTSTPFKPILISMIKFHQKKLMLKEEVRLHKKYSDVRLTGEWFLLKQNDVEEIVKEWSNRKMKRKDSTL